MTVDSDIDERILSTESLTRLRGALDRLPPEEREPIEIAFFGGLSYVAVAQQLGLPEGTVKSRIRCGLGRLRAECSENIPGARGADVSDSALMRNAPDHEVAI
jgi:RNA polymerase sigma factor (sigma-70 family)